MSFANVIKRGLTSASKTYKRKDATSVTTDRNIPQFTRKKAWESAREDKDSWFKRKYAHVHARQKQQERQDPYGKRAAHEKKIGDADRQIRLGRADHKQKFEKRNATYGLRANPLMEYVYGTNSVLAALQSDKREYFSRLLHYGALDSHFLQLVKKRNLQVVETDKHRLNLITNYAVHNNVALETKPLQPVEITHLGSCNPETTTLQVNEVLFENDHISSDLAYNVKENKKFPLGIYLDEVVDPHNIGAIIRSAYFLGADFVVMSRKNCAPLSPVVSKTSSGALELLPIFHVDKPLSFFTKSQEGGWTFITSSLTDLSNADKKFMSGKVLGLNDLGRLCDKMPVILVVGNEGNGVRTNLRMRSDFFVEIPFGRDINKGPVDSLNVSVATALLIGNILKS